METRSVLEYTVGSTLWLSSDSQSETLEVLVDEKSPFISTITMMDPSPDFFSGHGMLAHKLAIRSLQTVLLWIQHNQFRS
jgi:hypothetical protein